MPLRRRHITPSPHRDQDVAFARAIISDPGMLATVDPDKRRKCRALAWAILSQRPAPAPKGPAQVIPFPTRPPQQPTDPEDAA